MATLIVDMIERIDKKFIVINGEKIAAPGDTISSQIPAKVAELRRNRKWTRKRLQREARIDFATVKDMEEGNDPRISSIERIVGGMGYDLVDFFSKWPRKQSNLSVDDQDILDTVRDALIEKGEAARSFRFFLGLMSSKSSPLKKS